MRADRKQLILAAEVADARFRARPGALLLAGSRVLAAGPPASIGRPADAEVIEMPAAVVFPGLVNAHTHLDLSHIGPLPFAPPFADWLAEVTGRRAADEGAVADAVAHGIALARAGGTAIAGDIAGQVGGSPSLLPGRVMGEAGLAGVSYVEFFGIGRRQEHAVRRMREAAAAAKRETTPVRFGISPHAPYSCGPDVYAAAAELGLPLATHLAESLEEIEFVSRGSGPMADMLRTLGALDEPHPGSGLHPIDHLAGPLSAAVFLCAHVNYLEDRHIDLLAACHARVVYCPRSSAYFGHPAPDHAPHAYCRMLDVGLEVCLGTDSIVCLDTPDRISVLDEMRLLHARDGTDPRTLLAMATVAGARSLGFDPDLVTFAPGPVAGVIAVPCDEGVADPLRSALGRHDAPTWISEHDSAICELRG
ncbi:MAG: amidohydrolase family protein [Planctomycetota bacterium]|jgi:cytosine/adenosine deaminase-related metal-dependent hydrolase